MLLIGALSTTLTIQTLFSAPVATPPPRPVDSDWDAYKKINAAIADEKQKAKTFTEKEVKGWLRVQDWLDDGKQFFNFERFHVSMSGEVPLGGPYQVRQLKAFKETPYSTWAAETGAAATSPNTGLFAGPKDSPWQGIKVRQSYGEVLGIEDPSQEATKKVDTLQGALFSYTRNLLTDGDSWAFQGAVLLPFVWQLKPRLNPDAGLLPTADTQEQTATVDLSHWAVVSYGVIPSVSLFRVTDVQNNPFTTLKTDVDQLTFRVGLFEKISVPGRILDTMTFRGFATYLTDTGFESSVPAGQLEWEPQAWFSPLLTIGYATQLIPKQPTLDKKGDFDYTDTSYLAYQFRVRAHADYGTVVDSTTGLNTGDFLRVGPIAEFRLDPIVFRTLSASVSYSYLPALVGSNDHNSLLTMGAEWKLADNPKTHQSLSLKVNYTEGGIDITKQKVRVLVAGLGGTW
jgi:hypothetical protein